MRIVLVRHGRPSGVDTTPIRGRGIGDWVRGYDATGISPAVRPPPDVCRLESTTTCVLASDLRRAAESAAWIAGSNAVRLDPDLREAALPRSLPISLRLSPGVWVVLARLIWYAGLGDAHETLAETATRAHRAVARLAVLAEEHGTVVAVWHGMFNRFLAAELRRRGWDGPRFLPPGYWGSATFENGGRLR